MTYDVTVFSGEHVYVQGDEADIMMDFTDNTIAVDRVEIEAHSVAKLFRMTQLFADGEFESPGGPVHVKR